MSGYDPNSSTWREAVAEERAERSLERDPIGECCMCGAALPDEEGRAACARCDSEMSIRADRLRAEAEQDAIYWDRCDMAEARRSYELPEDDDDCPF